jgi:hypothetical protein
MRISVMVMRKETIKSKGVSKFRWFCPSLLALFNSIQNIYVSSQQLHGQLQTEHSVYIVIQDEEEGEGGGGGGGKRRMKKKRRTRGLVW